LPLVLLAREGWLTGRSVAVLVDEVGPANRTLAAAARIARQSRSPLTVLLRVSDKTGDRERVRDAEAALAASGIDKASVIAVSGGAVPGIVHAARACRARLLVMSSSEETGEAESIDELMRRFPGALMLVRS
jgi:pimeloyl-ACP methyl ester carboxylesterase